MLVREWRAAHQDVLGRARILVASCAAAPELKLAGADSIDYHLIIDDATEVYEATALIPITTYPRIDGILLVGDNARHPPVFHAASNPLARQLR